MARQLYIPFIRQDGLEINTLAIVRVDAKEEMEADDAIETLKEAVTKWVKETDEGRECWQQSGHDLNIGDLSLYESDFAGWATPRLKEAGITDFEILVNVDVRTSRSFDEALVCAGGIEHEED